MTISNDDFEQICFELISYSGAAKSSYIEAVEIAKAGKAEEAYRKIEEGDAHFLRAHHAHTGLLQEEGNKEGGLLTRLILVHAEDQLASAETIKIVCLQLIEVYDRIKTLEEAV